MKVIVFDAHRFERTVFDHANTETGHELTYVDARLTPETVGLVNGHPALCAFVNDRLNAEVLNDLHQRGIKLIALRSAGFNHVDLDAADRLGVKVVRVPAYSPHAIAEYAVGLILALNRRIPRAWNRVREHNFSLEGLVGFDLNQKTIGVVGAGKIGRVFSQIMRGFGCRVLLLDQSPDPAFAARIGAEYVDAARIWSESDVISLHVPLTPSTRHLMDESVFKKTKPGVMIINTGRGALIDSQALIGALKSGHIGAAGLDVYEEEEAVFFQDLSEQVLQDDVLARLLTFPNVLITSHQAFLTHEALSQIARTTLENIRAFERGEPLVNEVTRSRHVSQASTR